MVKRNIGTLVKEGIAGIPIVAGFAKILPKAYELGDYLSKTIKVESVNPDFVKFAVPVVTGLGLLYFAGDMMMGYDARLLKKQVRKSQKDMQYLHEDIKKEQEYVQELQEQSNKKQEKNNKVITHLQEQDAKLYGTSPQAE